MRELKIIHTENGLRLKYNSPFLWLFIAFFGFMLIEVGPLFLDMFPAEDKLDYIGIAFASAWLLGFLLIFAFGVIRKLFVRVELNPKGVFLFDWFKRRDILWCELKDYGITYEGKSRGGTLHYSLYFSEEVLEEKNRNKKKLKKVSIQVDMCENDYTLVLSEVISYCGRYSAVRPFVSEKRP